MKIHKNRIVAGIILGFLILMGTAPAMAENINLNIANTVQAGSITPIRWNYTGSFEPNVTIELFKDGILDRTIVSDAYIGDILYYNGDIPYGEGQHNYFNASISLVGMYQVKITGNTTSGLEVTNTSDLEITAATSDGCKTCHLDATNMHHYLVVSGRTRFGCADCHPVNGQLVIERSCLKCHNGTAFWANPVVNLGEAHSGIPPQDAQPGIYNVNLSNNTPSTGDLILVTLIARDDIVVTNVTVDGIYLTHTINYNWAGTITAIEGTHSVNVSASDNVGHVTWDNSTSYTATTPSITVTSPMTGDRWVRGTMQTITWTYTGNLGSSATVELLEHGDVSKTWNNVSHANGIGSLDWTIPSRFETSTYKIRVSAGDYSNTTGDFNIVRR